VSIYYSRTKMEQLDEKSESLKNIEIHELVLLLGPSIQTRY
jgi:hypothetical protein